MIQREHIIQKHAKLFVRDAVAAPHKFFAFDRGKASGRFTHMRQKARGVQKATPDTLLRVKGMLPMWCEFKAPGKKPDDDQERMGTELIELGDIWFWADSVTRYAAYLAENNVPLRNNADFLAQHHQGSADSEIAKAEAKAGTVKRPSAPRKPKTSISAIARFEAIRAKTR